MQTTVMIDDDLIADAKHFTGIQETSAVVKMALTRLIQQEAARRLALLGGTEPDFKAAPRWRSDDA